MPFFVSEWVVMFAQFSASTDASIVIVLDVLDSITVSRALFHCRNQTDRDILDARSVKNGVINQGR